MVDPHHSYPGSPSYIDAFSIKNLSRVLWAASSCLFLRAGAWIVEQIAPTSKWITSSVCEIHVKKYILSSGHFQWAGTFEFITASTERRAEMALRSSWHLYAKCCRRCICSYAPGLKTLWVLWWKEYQKNLFQLCSWFGSKFPLYIYCMYIHIYM